MNKTKMSVIIPVYNTEKYLRKCLDSVVNQTLKDIEIIIINDCTPDNSEKIIMEYIEKDDRIVYIKHEKNLGLGGARNTGISSATGEYQWHIDSDDFIDVNACEILYGTARHHDVEILTFSACNFSLLNGHYIYYDNYFSRDKYICNKMYSGVDFLKEARARGIFHCALWLNLLKTSFIKEFSTKFIFRENAAHQDTDYTPILYCNTHTVFCMHYTPYYRLIRDSSVTGSELTQKKMGDKFAVTLSLLNYIIRNKIAFAHPIVAFALKDYRYFLKIYNNDYHDSEKHFLNTINNIEDLIIKMQGFDKLNESKNKQKVKETNAKQKKSSFLLKLKKIKKKKVKNFFTIIKSRVRK